MEQLEVAEAWVNARNREVARLWHLEASGAAGLMAALVSIVM